MTYKHKKQRFKNIYLVLFSLILVFSVSLSYKTIIVKAQSGGDILAGLGCSDSNNDGSTTLSECFKGSSNDGKVSDFTDFKGSLEAPDASGYAEGLTQAQDARTFIRNVVNFALGFLGLIAVIIVIYGGVQMVLNTGGEGLNQGKKTITYAVVGLLVIMSSFALVNTVILAPSGKETSGTSTSINSGSIRGVTDNARFNYLAKEIQEIFDFLIGNYQFYITLQQTLNNLSENISAFDQTKCNIPYSSCITQFKNQIDVSLNPVVNLLNNQYANTKLRLGLQSLIKDLKNTNAEHLSQISSFIVEEDCDTSRGRLDANPCSDSDVSDIRSKFIDLKIQLIGRVNNVLNRKMPTFEILGATVDFNTQITSKNEQIDYPVISETYKYQLDLAKSRIKKVNNTVKGLASNMIGQEFFNEIISNEYFEKEAIDMQEFYESGTLNQKNIQTILINLREIYSLLKNLKFVNAVITADIQRGNAPLIVNFSSVGSSDPSGLGIIDSQIEWDLDGDGDFNKSSVSGCAEKQGAIASCRFDKPGTYRVSLRIQTNQTKINPATTKPWAQEIAPGISYMDILVNPPSAKINLKVSPANSSSTSQDVIKYEKSNIKINQNKIFVLTSEANSGITFDATDSVIGDTEEKLMINPSFKVRWDFGTTPNKTTNFVGVSDSTLKPTFAFDKAGDYPIEFEVMDQNNVSDRKFFTLSVSSVAPIITNPPTSALVNKDVIFDGSNSSSDSGSLIFKWNVSRVGDSLISLHNPAFKWFGLSAHAQSTTSTSGVISKIIDNKNKSENNDYFTCSYNGTKEDQLKCNFKKSGNYKINLILEALDGKTYTTETNINIQSNPPVSGFNVVRLDNSLPSVYELDASRLSFDQDEKDTSNMEYSWEINPNNCVLIGFADEMPVGELLKSATNQFSAQTPCSDLKDFALKHSKPIIKFTEKGDFSANLVTRISDEPNLLSDPFEIFIPVENTLDISWGEMKPSAILQVPTASKDDIEGQNISAKPVAPINFLFSSPQAISYEIDYGDGETDNGEMESQFATAVTHNYSLPGKYTATLTVFDADDIENSISRNIFIGNSKTPISIITTKVNGSEIEPRQITLDDGAKINNAIVVNRKDNITFTADKSVNTDGTGRRLSYSWNINNNEKQSTNKQISHNFSSLSEKNTPYQVKLTVRNEKDITQVGEDSVNILVIGALPIIRSLTAIPQDSSLITPVNINLTAISPLDPDGEIKQYKWWYYDASKVPSPDDRLGIQITTNPSANLTIGTRGIEGDKPEYAFGVELTDNDNNIVSTDSQNEVTRLNIKAPKIKVENGPNKAPVARFTVDRTSVNVGETVNFTSTSFDPDKGGKIKEYKWDFGDGSRGENLANVSHTYKKANVDGYNVKLTVVDDNFSEATSDSVKVYVDAEAEPPVAGFLVEQSGTSKTVKFKNTSLADTSAGAKIIKYSWDFDVSLDSNGDGIKDNDIDSGEVNPSYTYPEYGIYRAKLTVQDDQGQTRSVTNFVNIRPSQTAFNTDDKINIGASSSATKTLGANLFEAGDRVDLEILLFSIFGYTLFMIFSHKKIKQNKK